MKITGRYDDATWFCEVRADGRPVSPARSQKLINHSPDGFAWGYAGSGPAQLALAILLAAGCSNDLALRHYQAFKFEFIAKLPRASFELIVDIDAWLLARVIA